MIILLCVFGNILFGAVMLLMSLELMWSDLDEIIILGTILGVLVWVPYGIYKLITYHQIKKVVSKSKYISKK